MTDQLTAPAGKGNATTASGSPGRSAPPSDELDRTARQVRLDYDGATIHKLTSTRHKGGTVYTAACGEALSRAEGAILTTLDVDCWTCQGRHRNRGSRG
jgi:hypothetical protein